MTGAQKLLVLCFSLSGHKVAFSSRNAGFSSSRHLIATKYLFLGLLSRVGGNIFALLERTRVVLIP